MATIIKKNYKSDFDAILHLKSCVGDVCKEVGWPDYDWVARFYTTSHDNVYIASNIGGVLTNCFNDNGNIHVVFNNHGFPSGTLRVEFSAEIPNEIYPDGSQLEVSPQALNIELVRGVGDCGTIADVEVMLSFIKGDKGEPLTYDDLTEEQKAELQRPATEAAESVSKLEEEVSQAEALRISAEQTRGANEQARISAENKRVSDENERKANETSRQSNEATRTNNETERQQNEESRVSAEQSRAEEFATWEEEITSKQDALTTSDDLQISIDNKLSLTDMAKKRLFIDMWNAAWKIKNVVYGKYDLANAPDAEHPFMGNEIWMTYEEAMTVMEASSVNSNIAPYARIKGTLARTHTPIYVRQTCSFVEFARDCTQFEVLHIETSSANTISAFNYAFAYCIKLKEIKGVLFASATNFDNAFFQCRELQTINLRYLRANVSFAWSPNLSLASLQYLVANAANTSAITVTVHADVYAKLTGDTTNAAAAALTQEELTQWNQILVDAAAKNINFATS